MKTIVCHLLFIAVLAGLSPSIRATETAAAPASVDTGTVTLTFEDGQFSALLEASSIALAAPPQPLHLAFRVMAFVNLSHSLLFSSAAAFFQGRASVFFILADLYGEQ